MKKFICVLSIIVILFSFCACGSKEASAENTNDNSTTASDSSKETKTKKTNKTVKALSYDEFKTLMQSNGYEVYLENKSERGGIILHKGTAVAEYYTYQELSEARNDYLSKMEISDEQTKSESNPYSKQTEIGKNYEANIYTSQYDEYNLFVRADSNIIIISTNKTEGPQLAKALGF